MIPPILIAIGAAVLIFVATAIRGSGRTPGGATAVPGSHGATGLLRRYAGALSKYGSPMPAPAVALILYRESGGNPDAIARGAVTGASELGLAQLTVEHEGERGEAQIADVDPLDPVGAIYGVQHNYNWIRERLTPYLHEQGYSEPGTLDWIVLMHLGRSIGFRGMQTLLENAKGQATNPIDALRKSLDGTLPTIGRQTPDLVARRLRKALRLPADAATLGPIPTVLTQLPDRGDDVPRFDRAKAMRAIERA